MKEHVRTTRDGVRYTFRGSGTPALVFVHGFGCAGEDWDSVVKRLLTAFACVTLDLPGHGASATPARPDIASLGLAVSDVLADCGLESAVLVGHSLGTKIVRECVRQSSATVAGLVLVNGSTYAGDGDSLISGMKDTIDRAGWQPFIRDLFVRMFVAGSHLVLVERMIARALRLDPAIAVALLTDSIRWDIARGDDALRALHTPVLLLQSTYYRTGTGRSFMAADVVTPFMAQLASIVPKAEIDVMTGVGHFPMLEAPAETAARIERFVRSRVCNGT